MNSLRPIIPSMQALADGGDFELAQLHAAPVAFVWTPPLDTKFRVQELQIVIVTATAPSAHLFGDIPALTNGFMLNTTIDSIDRDIIPSGLAVKTLTDFATFTEKMKVDALAGTQHFLTLTFHFAECYGGYLQLQRTATRSDSLNLILIGAEDLSGLTTMRALVKGYDPHILD